MAVTNKEELNALIARVKKAQAVFATYTQAQVDAIFRNAALATSDARIPLAKLAVAETGMGVLEDKVIKPEPELGSCSHLLPGIAGNLVRRPLGMNTDRRGVLVFKSLQVKVCPAQSLTSKFVRFQIWYRRLLLSG